MKQIYFIALTAIFTLAPAFSYVAAQQATPYQVEYETPKKNKDIRVAIGGGYAYRLGKVIKTGNANLDNMNKQLRNGFTVDADAQYYFQESWGIGLNANFGSATSTGRNISIPGISGNINLKETQNIIYVGPSFVGRNDLGNFLIISNVGFGPLFYSSKTTINGKPLNGSKTTVGMNAGIAAEYKINAQTGAGLKLSYVMGSIESINIQGQNINTDEKMSVSNLMITAFLSFRTW